MKFRKLSEIDVSNERVFIRADLNVPQDEQGNITEDTRIKASLASIEYCLRNKAAVMICSHLGRPTEGQYKPQDSLAPVAQRLGELLKQPVTLIKDWINTPVKVSSGEVVLLENCRCHIGEKANDGELSKKMAAMCDIYVNDAFGTAHRKEATTVGIAQYAPQACAGFLMSAELDALNKALSHPKRPMLAIVGGAKVSTKLNILRKLAEKVDQLIVGGGIANTFLLASGNRIGASLAEPEMVREAQIIMDIMRERHAEIPLPQDILVADELSPLARANLINIQDIHPQDRILDFGSQSMQKIKTLIDQAGTIVWNGPIGVFEYPQFAKGTELMSSYIANSPAFSIAGGGDTLAAIHKFGISEKIDYISTGGGAFLEFLEGKTLPAVSALEARYY